MSASSALRTTSGAETEALAARLAPELRAGVVIALSGEMGTGKTTFVRGACRALGVTAPVTSPTFTLVHEYRGGRLPLIHVDLYRLERADLDEIGLDQDLADKGVVAVEWSERLSRRINGALVVKITDQGDDRRSIEISDP